MKKILVFSVFIVLCFIFSGCADEKETDEEKIVSETKSSEDVKAEKNVSVNYEKTTDILEEKTETEGNGVEKHGALKAAGGKIIGKNGEAVILKGMSSHGLAWYPQFANSYSIKKTKDSGANVFRAAMYTEEYGGYTTGESERENAEKILYSAVDNAISLDMYAVVDWHILNDGNPQKHKPEAIAFFDKASKKYAGNPAVIYEICNEPNGANWKIDIKPYAEEVIRVIRNNSPDALIIVGSGTWSQDVDEAAENPLEFENIAYAFHFYSGTHKLDYFKPKIEKALSKGVTVFVSEWGTSDAGGNNGNYFDEADKWLNYLDEKEISRINWSLCDKDESSAALIPGAAPETWNESNLSKSGKYIFDSFKK